MNKVIRYSLIGVCVISILGCAAGPDFKRPAAPNVSNYTPTPLKTNLASVDTELGESQTITEGKQLKKYWWQTLGSKKLNKLINEALKYNPSLQAAEATLRQAKEIYAARAGSTLYPQLNGSLGAQRQRINPESLGQQGESREFDLFNASVGVTYTFDLAGGNRRALESLAARTDYQKIQLEAANLTLVANIVTAVITQANLKRQIEIIENILKSQENQLEVTRERIRLGQGDIIDELSLQTQLEQTRSKIPLLYNQLQQNEHLLSVLVGKAPGKDILPSFTLEDFNLPSELPLLIPSKLVRARPDILGAEALLHAANAEYGVAVANLYPQLNLTANLGTQALTTGALFGPGSAVWSLLGQLTQPLFNPGLPAEKRAALAAFDAAAANYQYVVLEALRNVADVLRALENDSKRLQALAAADYASNKSLETIQHRYELGSISYQDLLIAQQQRLQTKLDLTEGQAQRLVNTVAFYQAMGGGLFDTEKVDNVTKAKNTK